MTRTPTTPEPVDETAVTTAAVTTVAENVVHVVTTSAATFTVTTRPTSLQEIRENVAWTTASGTVPRSNPATFQGDTLRSPYEDPRVRWIHELRKEALTQEMARFGLDTTGKVEDLRKRFCQFWKDPNQWPLLTTADMVRGTQHPIWVTTEASGGTSSSTGGAYGANLMEHRRPEKLGGTEPSADWDERTSIREILGLSPEADSLTVRRTLTEALRNPHTRGDVVIDEHRPPRTSLGTRVTYSEGFAEPISHGRGISLTDPLVNPQVTGWGPDTAGSMGSYQRQPTFARGENQRKTDWVSSTGYLPQVSSYDGWHKPTVSIRHESEPSRPIHPSTSLANPVRQTGCDLPWPLVSSDLNPLSGAGVNLRRLDPEFDQRERYIRMAPGMTDYPFENSSRETQTRMGGHKSNRDFTAVCNSVRKWNVRFDGKKDPVSFMERLDELIETYALTSEDVLRALPELLQGEALLWYRNMKGSWSSVDGFRSDFVTQFFPLQYQRNLDEEIRKRTQGENESFRSYLTAILTLIRRSADFSADKKVNLIYTNMRPEYKLMVRRSDFATIPELTRRAEEYESYLRDRDIFRPPPSPAQALVPETAYVHKRKNEKGSENAAFQSATGEPGVPTGRNNPSAMSVSHSPGRRDALARPDNRHKGVEPRTSQPHRIANPQQTVNPARGAIVCWNCDRQGHRYKTCPEPKRVRCFRCKKEGVTTMRCGCRAGNGGRAQNQGGRLSPQPQRDARPPTSGPVGSHT